MNAHEAVVAASLAQLLVPPAVADEVTRGRGRPVSDTVASAVRVRFGGSVPQRGSIKGAPIDWLTTIIFESHARGSDDVDLGVNTSGEQAALAVHQTAWERLFSDPTLGGLVMDMEPGPVDVDDDELDDPLGCVRSAVRVLHRTSAYSLEA